MYEPCLCGADDCPACFPGRASRKHYALGSLDAEDIDILHEQAAADEEAELASRRMREDEDAKETTMFHPDTHGPVYRTTDAYAAFCAWDVDDTQWVLTDGTAYLVGYAPAIFRDGPMAQGWRITCPEALMQRALGD